MTTGVSSSPVYQIAERVLLGWTTGCTMGFSAVKSAYRYGRYILDIYSIQAENQKQLQEKEWAPVRDKIQFFKNLMGINEEIELWGSDISIVSAYGAYPDRGPASAGFYNGKPYIGVNNLSEIKFLTLSEEEQNFVLCHELSHIQHRDGIDDDFYITSSWGSVISLIFRTTLVATIFFTAIGQTNCHWIRPLTGVGISVAALIICKVALTSLYQWMEKRADRDAFTCLKNAKQGTGGGVSFFNRVLLLGPSKFPRANILTRFLRRSLSYLLTKVDLADVHPSTESRIKYMQAWIAQASKTPIPPSVQPQTI